MERSPFCGREILRTHLRPGQSSTCEGAEMEGALLEDLMERVTKIRKVKVKKKTPPPKEIIKSEDQLPSSYTPTKNIDQNK